MSKPIKNLITESYRRRFAEVDGAIVVEVRGITSNENNRIRGELSKQKMKVTVVRNALAKRAFAGTKLENLSQLIDGPSALVYGGDSVVNIARSLVELAKEIEKIQFKGALMEGQLYQPDQIDALSKYPTRQEAQAQVVTLLFSPGKKLAAQILGPGKKVASLIKAIEEKKEKEGAGAPAAPAAS